MNLKPVDPKFRRLYKLYGLYDDHVLPSARRRIFSAKPIFLYTEKVNSVLFMVKGERL